MPKELIGFFLIFLSILGITISIMFNIWALFLTSIISIVVGWKIGSSTDKGQYGNT